MRRVSEANIQASVAESKAEELGKEVEQLRRKLSDTRQESVTQAQSQFDGLCERLKCAWLVLMTEPRQYPILFFAEGPSFFVCGCVQRESTGGVQVATAGWTLVEAGGSAPGESEHARLFRNR